MSGAMQDDFQNQLDEDAAYTPPAYAPPPGPPPVGGALGAAPRPTAPARERFPAIDTSVPPSGFAPTPPSSGQGGLKDFGDQVWASSLSLGQDLEGAASFAARQLGASPRLVQFLEQQKAEVAGHVEKTIAGMSPAAQTAMHASLFNDGSPGQPTWGQAGYIRTAAATVAGMLPQVAMAVLPGAIVGKVAAAAISAGGFGLTDAGAAYNAIVEQVDRATPAELAKSPVYAELRGKGLSDLDARKQLVQAVAPAMAAGHFAAGAAAGAGIGGLATKGALGVAGRGALGRAAIGGTEGAVTMGAQAGADNALDQTANQQLGVQPSFDPSETARAVASGAIGGAVLGGAFGAWHKPEPAKPAPAPPSLAPDVAAALDETLQITGPKGAPLALPAPPHVSGDGFTMGAQPPPPAPPPAPPAPTRSLASANMGRQQLYEAIINQPGREGLSKQALRIASLDELRAEYDHMQPPPGVAPSANQPDLGFRDQTERPEPHIPPGQSQGELLTGGGPNAPATVPPGVSLDRSGTLPPVPPHPLMELPAAAEAAATATTRTPAPNTSASVPPSPPAAARLARSSAPVPSTPAPSTPLPTGRETTKTERARLTNALVASGQDRITLAHTSMGDLRAYHDALINNTKPPEPTPAPSGQDTPAVVTDTARDAPPAIAPATDVPPADTASNPVSAGAVVRAMPSASELKSLGETLPGMAQRVGKMFNDAQDARKAAGLPEETFEEFHARTMREQQTPIPETPAPKPLSKRELEKARMAAAKEATGSPLKSTGYVDPETVTKSQGAVITQSGERVGVQHDDVLTLTQADKPTVSTATAPTITEAPEHVALVRAAAERAGRMAELAPAPNKSWADEVSKVVASAKSAEEVFGALEKYGDQNRTTKVPGSKYTRAALVDQTLKLLNKGKGLSSAEAYRKQLVAEEGRGAQVYENEKGVAELTHSSDTGVTDYERGSRERSEDTTDIKRKGEDLVEKVLQGALTPAEAHAEFPTQKPGPGRRQRWPNFGAFLSDHIKTLEADPARKTKLLEALIKSQKFDDVTAKATRETARLSNEHIEKLREIERELNDPVGHAADQSTQGYEPDEPTRSLFSRAVPDGIMPPSSRFVQAASEARLNQFIPDQMRAREAVGGNYGLYAALDAVINHAGLRAEARPLVELARNIRKWVKDLPVLSQDEAVRRGLMSFGERYQFDGGALGIMSTPSKGLFQRMSDARHDHIVLNTNGTGHVETLLHEALHSVTADHIDNLLKADPNHPELQALRAIQDELHRQGASGANFDYATSNLHELHTMLMSNPELQAFAASRQASPELRAHLRELGFPPREQGRSIWQAFKDWVRRALGLPKVASASEDTLLDHVMRPLQDITERAGRENMARDLPTDPVLRSHAEPLYHAAAGSFGKAKDDALRRADFAGIGDRLRKGVLPLSTLDAIHNWNETLFNPSDRLAIRGNPLTRFRAAMEAISYRAATFHADFVDPARDLATRLKGRTELAQLQNDATIAGVRLGDPSKTDNTHLTTPEQQAALTQLQARFAKLTPADQATYQDTRDHYAKTYRQERDAQLKSLVATALPDATPEQIAALTKVTRSKSAIDKFIKSGTDPDLVSAFGSAWNEDHQALAKGIARVHAQGFVPGDYFPLRRYGDYLIRYGVEGEQGYGVERFEKRSDADARHAELEGQGADDLSQVQIMGTSFTRAEGMNSPIADELAHRMRQRGASSAEADTLRDMVNRIQLEHATHSERARATMRRRGVTGADLDAAKTMAREFLSAGSRIGHLEHGADRNQALRDMRLVTNDLSRAGAPGEGIRAQAVTHELEQRVAVLEDQGGMLAGIARRAGAFGFIQSLMSPSHMITSSIEAHMNSSALLGARHGVGRSTLALAKALADVSPKLLTLGAKATIKAMGQGLKAADWKMSHVARDALIKSGADAKRMTDLFHGADMAGLVDHTADAEMRRIANASGITTTTVGKYWQRFMDLNAAGAHAVDTINKSAILKAAYDLEYKTTGNHAAAKAYAIEVARQSIPNYNLANKARITTAKGPLGALAGPVTQFKQYGIHMYGVMANLAKASVHGADRDTRVEARKAFAGILATHAMMAGGLTLIADPLRYIWGAYDLIFGPAGGKPHDYENDVRGFLSDTFGPELAEVMARGLPHLAGIDIHRRVGLGNLLEVPELKSFDMKGMGEMLATAVSGAAGEDAERLGLGAIKMLHGDMGGLLDMVPRPVRDIGKAVKLDSQGVTDSKGRTILAPEQITPYDKTVQALGFQPSRVSEFREGRFAVQEAETEAKSDRDKLMTEWIQNPAERSDIMVKIREWSQDHRGMAITNDALLRRLQAEQKQARQPADRFGLRLAPKAAPQLIQAGRFAAP